MDAWILWANYGTQTGDYSMARKFISPNFKRELEEYKNAEELYQSGGWIIGGIDHFLADGNPWSEDGETYFWKAYREWDREIFVEPDGSWVSWTNDDKTDLRRAASRLLSGQALRLRRSLLKGVQAGLQAPRRADSAH